MRRRRAGEKKRIGDERKEREVEVYSFARAFVSRDMRRRWS